MKLEGVHHVTAITADAPRNVEFYAGLLGPRLVKKTVNPGDPTLYHPFYADERSREFLEQTLEFDPRGEGWEARGERRGGLYEYDAAPEGPGIGGAGTVHHVAWASPPEEHEPWRERVAAAGAHVTPIIDRFYFKSIYFREPSGVLFEIATIGPGFATDEPIEHLGERLSLPPA